MTESKTRPGAHLYPVQADVLRDIAQTFVFMTASELEAERQAIAECLAEAPYARPPSLDQAASLGILFAQLAPFAEPPDACVLRRNLGSLSVSQNAGLVARLGQIQRAIPQALRPLGRDRDPTEVFAVSPIWHQRWDVLIGGALYPAFVGFVEIGQP